MAAFLTRGAAAEPNAAAVGADDYQAFLWDAATAQRAARVIGDRAIAAGVRPFSLDRDDCAGIKPGDRLLFTFGDRTVVLVSVAKTSEASSGWSMVGAHIDSPALRVLPDGLSSDRDGAGLRVRAYGGIRPSHYTHRRLRLVGQLTLSGGRVVELSLPEDVTFVTTDGATTGASVGSSDDGQVAIAATKTAAGADPKTSLRAALAKAMGEETLAVDALAAAELFLVSADRPRRYGLDGKLIGGPGQDDRALSYALLKATLAVKNPHRSVFALFADREEVGSRGRTGTQAPLFEQVTACLARSRGARGATADVFVRDALARSQALSTDVKPALSPLWPEVQDPKNAPVLGAGPTLVKYTGHQGKRNASDAHPELAGQIRALATRHQIPLQTSESGLVDEGGGGTIAKFMAAREIDVIDLGLPLLSMHAPLELIHIDDLAAATTLLGYFLRGEKP